MDNLRIFWLCSAIFPITLASALAAIYGIRLFCRRNGFVDRPDGERKTHKSPVALGGGIAVLAAVGVGFAAAFGLDRLLPLGMVEGAPSELMFEWDNQWLMLIMCGASIAIVGLIDDWFQLRGRQKLLAQIVIVSVLAIFSQQIDGFAFFGIEISLGAFAIPVSIVWLLGSVNALNLIDGADGMATTTGAIISAGLAAMAFIIGDAVAGIIALCMCAALIGFFCFNRPPATIYLGDAGSMMIGLILGTLALWISAKETTILAVAPVAVLSVPLFDSAVAILRRWLTGRSIYTTDRGHLHHCLLQKFTPWQMLGLVVLMCGATTTASVISVYMQREWIAVAGAMGVLVLLVVSGVFGRRELQLLMDR
ncbi:MAG: MraY family glycosyltransferase, partial [Planctomycetota bacterium]